MRRIIAVYMPHSGYPDEDVEAVYASLERILQEARRKKMRSILAGDFNAEVGSREEFDDPSILGLHGVPLRSRRGDWLLRWCTKFDLVIANTMFNHDQENM